MKRLYVFTLIALASVSIASADLLDGLVLYMPLDEGAGKKITGLSENAFEGEIQGNAKWVDGKFGKALGFSSSADKVSIDDFAFVGVTENFSKDIKTLSNLMNVELANKKLNVIASNSVIDKDDFKHYLKDEYKVIRNFISYD